MTADAGSVEVEAPIPHRDLVSIQALWKIQHGFLFPDNMMLNEHQCGRVWRSMNMKPSQMDAWFSMKIRHRGEMNPKVAGHTLSFVPGKQVEALEVTLDVVEDKLELWSRVRALLMTMAYVSVQNPAWFPLQTAILTSEHLLRLITATFKKQRPPLEHMISAWDNTVHTWSESVRMTEQKPAVVIGNFSTWESKFAWQPAAASSGDASGSKAKEGNGGGGGERDDKKLQNTIASLQGQIKMMQNQQKAADAHDGRAFQGKAAQNNTPAGKGKKQKQQGNGNFGNRGKRQKGGNQW